LYNLLVKGNGWNNSRDEIDSPIDYNLHVTYLFIYCRTGAGVAWNSSSVNGLFSSMKRA